MNKRPNETPQVAPCNGRLYMEDQGSKGGGGEDEDSYFIRSFHCKVWFFASRFSVILFRITPEMLVPSCWHHIPNH